MAEGSLALEHLVLLLCGLTDDLKRKRIPVHSSAGRRTAPQPAAPTRHGGSPASPRRGLEQAQLAESAWVTAPRTHSTAPAKGKGTKQTAHLPIPSLDGLDHHCLLGMDLGTPLLRACFCNRSIHMLSLTKSRPRLLQGPGDHLYPHGAEPRRLPPPRDRPGTFSARLLSQYCP